MVKRWGGVSRASILSLEAVLIVLVLSAQPRVISTFAGAELTFSGDGKPAVSASLGAVKSVAADVQEIFISLMPAITC